MLRCVLDNMIFDEIAGSPGLTSRLHRLTAADQLDLLVTSRQAEELRASQKPQLVALLDEIPVGVIGAAPFLVGISRLDLDRLGPSDVYDALRGAAPNPNNINDHLGAATADLEGLPFVTQDKRLHRRASRITGVEIWWWRDLLAELSAL